MSLIIPYGINEFASFTICNLRNQKLNKLSCQSDSKRCGFRIDFFLNLMQKVLLGTSEIDLN